MSRSSAGHLELALGRVLARGDLHDLELTMAALPRGVQERQQDALAG